MREPVRSGEELLREIEELDCPTPALWWLGHCGFALKWHSSILYIDPYLSDTQAHRYRKSDWPHNRLVAPPLDPAAIGHADLLLATHAHCAHLDPGTAPKLLEASKSARLVLPKSAAGRAHMMGIDYLRMTTLDADQRLDYIARDGEVIRIDAIASAHESLDWTQEDGYPYLGYVLRMGGLAIYHAGDCAPYDGLAEKLHAYGIDLALLPINGRDPGRGMPGNFTIHEAAALAETAGIRCVAPMHYGMFAVNDVSVDLFIDHMLGHHPGVRFKIFDVGECWLLPEKE